MKYAPELKLRFYKEIIPNLKKEFSYSSVMQVPRLKKIILNQGLGQAINDKKIIEVALKELSAIAGQKAVTTTAKKDISNFKLRKNIPIGVRVTLRKNNMYEFLHKLVNAALPRVRDFRGVKGKFDGFGNYTLGITEQIIFPEILIDNVYKIKGMNITFVTSARNDKEGFALLQQFGLPFQTKMNN